MKLPTLLKQFLEIFRIKSWQKCFTTYQQSCLQYGSGEDNTLFNKISLETALISILKAVET